MRYSTRIRDTSHHIGLIFADICWYDTPDIFLLIWYPLYCRFGYSKWSTDTDTSFDILDLGFDNYQNILQQNPSLYLDSFSDQTRSQESNHNEVKSIVTTTIMKPFIQSLKKKSYDKFHVQNSYFKFLNYSSTHGKTSRLLEQIKR